MENDKMENDKIKNAKMENDKMENDKILNEIMGNSKRNIVNLSQVMLPNQANVAGNVHGGEIMKMMDSAAGAVAAKYSKANCVTARADELQFHLPIFVGALVNCRATVVHTGRSSMEVYVYVTSEDITSDIGPQKALSAYFTMVALGKNGKPQNVPSFLPETEEEKALSCQAKVRIQAFKDRVDKMEACML